MTAIRVNIEKKGNLLTFERFFNILIDFHEKLHSNR